MATIPAHFSFIAEQLKLLRDWEPRIAEEDGAEGVEALVDAALALYASIGRTEREWADKVATGEWQWNDGHDRDVAALYRDWHRAAGEVVAHIDAPQSRNVAAKNASALREAFGKVSALLDIGLDQVFQKPTPPQRGTSLREVRDGLQR